MCEIIQWTFEYNTSYNIHVARTFSVENYDYFWSEETKKNMRKSGHTHTRICDENLKWKCWLEINTTGQFKCTRTHERTNFHLLDWQMCWTNVHYPNFHDRHRWACINHSRNANLSYSVAYQTWMVAMWVMWFRLMHHQLRNLEHFSRNKMQHTFSFTNKNYTHTFNILRSKLQSLFYSFFFVVVGYDLLFVSHQVCMFVVWFRKFKWMHVRLKSCAKSFSLQIFETQMQTQLLHHAVKWYLVRWKWLWF